MNIIKFHILFLIFFCMGAKEETFADSFKPYSLSYLYHLVDVHVEMKDDLERMFRVKKIYNEQQKQKKVIAFSLFWKAPLKKYKQPMVNEDTINQKSHTIKGNKSFNDTYVRPLIKQLAILKKHYPGWIARIYLAGDLEFLIPRLAGPDREIFVMESDSIAAAPGSLWRFLVFDDPQVSMAYVKDADTIWRRLDGNFWSARIKRWFNSPDTKGFFRVRDLHFCATEWVPLKKTYSPISAAAFGGKKVSWINMEKAMKGFIIHRMLHKNEPRHPQDIAFKDHPYGFGNEFPNYGFDERFLKHVLYFAAADRNELTLIPTGYVQYIFKKLPSDHWVVQDLKYTKFKSLDGDY